MKLRGLEHFYTAKHCKAHVSSFAQISFGATSALMAALLPEEVSLCFENTGMEREETLEFGLRLQDALQREIIWLEYRPPLKKGDAPKHSRFERVTFNTASREGEPFEMLLDALAAYRETKGLGPVVPWANMRLCTGHLKHKVAERYIKSLGVTTFDQFIGLRADEPKRVHDLMKQETRRRCFRVPLHSMGITKDNVDRFWAQQTFRLELQPHEGNCSLCFLKDQADRSRLMMDPRNQPGWWKRIQAKYPGFGGQSQPSYEQLAAEAPARLIIEQMLRGGTQPAEIENHAAQCPELLGRERLYSITPRRWKNIVRQEAKRLEQGPASISCACEGSMGRDWDTLVSA